MRKVSIEKRYEDRDEVVGHLLVELSTADMSKPTLSRIDHLVIARVRQRNRHQTFTFSRAAQIAALLKVAINLVGLSFVRSGVTW